MNLSMFSFYEFYTLKEQELGTIAYMKDVVLYEAVSNKICFIIFEALLYFL
jgi:hypothetical protein